MPNFPTTVYGAESETPCEPGCRFGAERRGKGEWYIFLGRLRKTDKTRLAVTQYWQDKDARTASLAQASAKTVRLFFFARHLEKKP
jgi:hypothetical protein